MIGSTKLPPINSGLTALVDQVATSVIEKKVLPEDKAGGEAPSTAARGVERLSGPDLSTLRLALTNTASALRTFATEAGRLTQDISDYDGPSYEYWTRRIAPVATNASRQLTALLTTNGANLSRSAEELRPEIRELKIAYAQAMRAMTTSNPDEVASVAEYAVRALQGATIEVDQPSPPPLRSLLVRLRELVTPTTANEKLSVVGKAAFDAVGALYDQGAAVTGLGRLDPPATPIAPAVAAPFSGRISPNAYNAFVAMERHSVLGESSSAFARLVDYADAMIVGNGGRHADTMLALVRVADARMAAGEVGAAIVSYQRAYDVMKEDYPDLALTTALGDALARRSEVPVLSAALMAECATASEPTPQGYRHQNTRNEEEMRQTRSAIHGRRD